MVLAIILLVLWLWLLGFAADKLINSSVRIAKFFKLSPLFIGLTVLAIGTSAPELFLSAMSALSGNWSLSVGNVVGSNIFNLWFILGLSAIVAPILIKKKMVRRDGLFLIWVTSLLFVFLWDQTVTWWEWATLLALLVGYNWYLWIKKEPVEEEDNEWSELPKIKNFIFIFVWVLALALININTENWFHIDRGFSSLYSPIFMAVVLVWFAISMFMKNKKWGNEEKNNMWLNITKLIASIWLLVMSADVIVDSAVFVAEQLWMSQWAIGATIIAAGTSLPEIAATLAAIIKKKYDMWVGNVIWSDIFNILWIAWISSVISNPLAIEKTSCIAEWLCNTPFWWTFFLDNMFSMLILIFTLAMTLIFMRTWWKLSKAEWAVLFLFACLRMAFEVSPQFFTWLF